jgi:hypothetical protein
MYSLSLYNKKKSNKQNHPPPVHEIQMRTVHKQNGRQNYSHYHQFPFNPFARSLSKFIFDSFKLIRPFLK